MTVKRLLAGALGALALAAAAPAALAADPEGGIKAGILKCDVEGGVGFVFGSSRDMRCVYTPADGPPETYTGAINRYGIDIGYTDSAVVVWAVFAPTQDIGAGALAGSYGGVGAEATVGVGLGANVLIGGSNAQIALQPVSVEGTEGLNLAAGIAALELRAPGKQ